ncbi:MAG: hypothetical protein M1835_006387 [Candelina submexicana]|nr:MAG: hypothetical protein M1835_006387 [Candelina submexicana]
MSTKDATTPRLFLCRHGETEWSRSGRYTGTTDLPLLPSGEAQVLSTARILVGPRKLIDPNKVAKVWVSPRKRAVRTALSLFQKGDVAGEMMEVTEGLAEWDYGDYEGLLTEEIREKRKGEGRDGERGWDIWRDGSPQQVTTRLDTLIAKIRDLQAPHMSNSTPADVVLVAHGHILRAFTKRWLGYPLEFPLSMMLEPGGVGILSYQHNNIEEPAFLLGMGFPLETEEQKVEK